MIYRSAPKGQNRWTVSRSHGKTIAEISLSKGEYTIHPVKKLTKDDSRAVTGWVAVLRLEGCGEPAKGTDEALLARIEEALDGFAGQLEDRGILPELVESLDVAAQGAQNTREALRLLRAA